MKLGDTEYVGDIAVTLRISERHDRYEARGYCRACHHIVLFPIVGPRKEAERLSATQLAFRMGDCPHGGDPAPT